MRWLEGISNAVNTNLGKLWEIMRDKEAWGAAIHAVTKSQTKRVTEQQKALTYASSFQ